MSSVSCEPLERFGPRTCTHWRTERNPACSLWASSAAWNDWPLCEEVILHNCWVQRSGRIRTADDGAEGNGSLSSRTVPLILCSICPLFLSPAMSSPPFFSFLFFPTACCLRPSKPLRRPFSICRRPFASQSVFVPAAHSVKHGGQEQSQRSVGLHHQSRQARSPVYTLCHRGNPLRIYCHMG